MLLILLSTALPVALPDLSRAENGALTIEEAIRLALERNERAQISDQLVLAAEARVDRARAFFFPDITIGADYVMNSDAREGGSGTSGTGVTGSRTERSVTTLSRPARRSSQ